MPRWAPWAEAGVEPNIADVLSEPIVHMLMRADGVHAADLLAILFGGDDRSADGFSRHSRASWANLAHSVVLGMTRK